MGRQSTASCEAAQALGTRDVFKIVRLRSLSDHPVLFEETYIPVALFADFEEMPETALRPLL